MLVEKGCFELGMRFQWHSFEFTPVVSMLVNFRIQKPTSDCRGHPLAWLQVEFQKEVQRQFKQLKTPSWTVLCYEWARVQNLEREYRLVRGFAQDEDCAYIFMIHLRVLWSLCPALRDQVPNW